MISRASAQQRAGRAGRSRAGQVCEGWGATVVTYLVIWLRYLAIFTGYGIVIVNAIFAVYLGVNIISKYVMVNLIR